MSTTAVAWILLGALVGSAGVGFTGAAALVSQSLNWVQRGSRTPALLLLLLLCGLTLWSTVGRIAVIFGLTAGLCYLLLGRLIPGGLRWALGWLQVAVGGCIATGAIVLFPDNLLVLLVLGGWGLASAAAGALLVERQVAEVETIEATSDADSQAITPVAMAVQVGDQR